MTEMKCTKFYQDHSPSIPQVHSITVEVTAVRGSKKNCQTVYCVGESTMNNINGKTHAAAVKRIQEAIKLTTSLLSLKSNGGVSVCANSVVSTPTFKFT